MIKVDLCEVKLNKDKLAKLEEAVKNIKISHKNYVNQSYKDMSRERLTAMAIESTNHLTNLENKLNDEMHSHSVRMAHINTLKKMLNGFEGYISICQDDSRKWNVQSGFTALEELPNLYDKMKAAFEPIDPFIGYEVYKVQENGILELVAVNRDTSDSGQIKTATRAQSWE